MALVLPPNNAGVPLPVGLPANVIPTLVHVANAEDYLTRLKGSAKSGLPQQANRLEIAAAFRYKTTLALASTAPAALPAWLQPFMIHFQQALENNTAALHEEIAGIRQDIVGLRQDIVGLQVRVDDLREELTDQMAQVEECMDAMNIVVAKIFNGQASEGCRQRYTIVPLPDGSNPVTDRGLPAIRNATDLDNLSGQACLDYLDAYNVPPPHPNPIKERKMIIANEIGANLRW